VAELWIIHISVRHAVNHMQLLFSVFMHRMATLMATSECEENTPLQLLDIGGDSFDQQSESRRQGDDEVS